jgi:hypothetical protein
MTSDSDGPQDPLAALESLLSILLLLLLLLGIYFIELLPRHLLLLGET